ncbi:MAG: aminopeptidase N [Pseudomonadota bacterium]
MSKDAPQVIYLKDYMPPAYLVDTVDLHFELGEAVSTVRSRLGLQRNPDGGAGAPPLVLDGQALELVSVAMDGRQLALDAYAVDSERLVIAAPPAACTLEIVTRLKPQENTALEGLYKSGGNFCTQCEAQGFRRITYFPDRPDVMARYTTTIVAEQARYPVLLSNGNLVESGVLDDGRHWARWQDPFPKPSYLFALVAGDLVRIEDSFTTRSGRPVALHLYVQRQNADKCEHAMRSLKQAMQWDEDVYGREYDLDVYMIVAVDDFNMGAMENKGLNIFNSKYVLARPDTATDSDYEGIQAVIGHEYFHNWTGNRITCRDWFQLSLKEGLTVFRDQEFSADMGSRAVKRINDVKRLRSAQFPEDAGPMAHPVRPESYIEISNFYTATVYEKGAEVIRMMHTLLGPAGFRQGMDLYFERHDGQAVTTEDFVKCMEDANGADLGQFRLWYSQAGTPVLEAAGSHDAAERTYTLRVWQSCPPTPGQPEKAPMHIPLALGLLDADGCEIPLQLAGEAAPVGTSRVLNLRQTEESFCFVNVPSAPVPSLLRGFSAPVKLRMAYSDAELAFLLAHDTDPFSRWEAGQQLAGNLMLRLIDEHRAGRPLVLDPALANAYARTLQSADLDPAFKALALTLPAESYVAELMEVVDPQAIHVVREFLRRALAEALRDDWLRAYEAHRDEGPYRIDGAAIGRRSLKNLCLGYLMSLDEPDPRARCMAQFRSAGNMTDAIGALSLLANSDSAERVEALAAFYERWRHDALVVDKWFTIQATAKLPGTLDEVKRLLQHPAFELKNPNKVRALIGAFAHGNPARFHDAGGAGYAFVAEQVLRLDPLNPQVAARLVAALSRWRRFDAGRQALMRAQLERILAAPSLSKDVYEIVAKSLADA